jgi:hypothetical protein
LIPELITKIAAEQSEGGKHFRKGLFPAFRMNRFWKYSRPDNNLFTSLQTAFILKQYLEYMPYEQKRACGRIIEGVVGCLSAYENKSGRLTYNFWQNGKYDHFPFGRFARYLKHFKLPDDVDDTALAFMIRGYTQKEMISLKELLSRHVHPDGVYDTWFGVNMPKEKDVCTLCNLMFLILECGLSLNANDFATLEYLNGVIISGKYQTDTFWVSRHYGRVSLIFYHYARLIYSFDLPQLEESRAVLIQQLPEVYQKENNSVDKLLLKITAAKLGVELPSGRYTNSSEKRTFYSFIGAPFAPLKSPLFKSVAHSPEAWIGWKCRAHELALEFENQILQNR